MDKADKKQISRHTSICISSFFPPIFLSLSFTYRCTCSLFSHAHKHPKINSSLRCMQICTHKKNTDTGEWMCRQATFILAHSKNRRQCVRSLTCDTQLILCKKKKILEKAQGLKQSLKSILCWFKKTAETRASDFSTGRQTQLISLISGRQGLIGQNHSSVHIYMHEGVFFLSYVHKNARVHSFTLSHTHTYTHAVGLRCVISGNESLWNCALFFSLPFLSVSPNSVSPLFRGWGWSRCLEQK